MAPPSGPAPPRDHEHKHDYRRSSHMGGHSSWYGLSMEVGAEVTEVGSSAVAGTDPRSAGWRGPASRGIRLRKKLGYQRLFRHIFSQGDPLSASPRITSRSLIARSHGQRSSRSAPTPAGAQPEPGLALGRPDATGVRTRRPGVPPIRRAPAADRSARGIGSHGPHPSPFQLAHRGPPPVLARAPSGAADEVELTARLGGEGGAASPWDWRAKPC